MREQFILYENPIKHRMNVGSNIVITNGDNRVVNTIELPVDEYLCDFCNDFIPVQTDDGKPLAIFVLNNNNALCADCVKLCFTQDITLYEGMGWCTCCTVDDTYLYLYKQENDMYKSIVRFSTQGQADWFGSLYAGHTGTELICVQGDLSEPLQ